MIEVVKQDFKVHKDVKILKGLFSQDEFNSLCKHVKGGETKWNISHITTPRKDQPDYIGNRQIVNILCVDDMGFVSADWHYYKPITDALGAKRVLRAKLNATMGTVEPLAGYPHTDTKIPMCTTAVVYLNTCNGYTAFEETGEKSMSMAGRALVFPSHCVHYGVSATDVAIRYTLNLNYLT